MKATIESTTSIIEMNDSIGRPFRCRVWEGVSEGGVAFTAYIPIVQVKTDQNNSEFERELSKQKPPDAETLRAIDLRFII
jgi:hypothetical protein